MRTDGKISEVQSISDDIFDSMLKMAFLELERERTAALLKKIEEGTFEVSQAELDSMNDSVRPKVYQLIDREMNKENRKRFFRHTLPKMGQIAAGLLLIFFISATTAVATVRSVRVRVLEFLIEVEREYTSLSLRENPDMGVDVPADWTGRYYPGYIPEGFVFSEVIEDADGGKLRFINADGRILMLSENGANSSTNVDTENAYTEYTMINGWNVLLFHKGDISSGTWADFDRYYVLRFDGDISETIKIIESLLKIG